MSMPAMDGEPAASAAEAGAKSFPPGTDPASIVMVSGVAHDPVLVGTPVVAPSRVARPVAEWGAGYSEVPADGNVH